MAQPDSKSRFESMLETARHAVALRPHDFSARFAHVEALLICGRHRDAQLALEELEILGWGSAQVLARISATYAHAADHAGALRSSRRASELAADDPDLLANLAASEMACGLLDEAEAHFARIIEIRPRDAAAYYNRATLRRQTQTHNHVPQLEALLSLDGIASKEEVPLCYALAKELEDIGEYGESFRYLARGAAKRRATMAYRVESDEAALAQIVQTFDGLLLRRATRREAASSSVFIMGLPRSGTTLVDRILCCHSQAASLGEINDFELSLVQTAGDVSGKLELIRRCGKIDFRDLGRAYTERIASYGIEGRRIIDKTPRNYLYLGLIALALPDSTVLHLRRDPMDVCYALFKNLFGAGCPFSYDLNDLGRYYLAYDTLMRHWREHLPDAFLDIDYESVVFSQESVSRRIVDHCQLPWEPACLEFHRSAAPAATASAAQVREPIYARSVGMWRRYANELAPLARTLRDGGVDFRG